MIVCHCGVVSDRQVREAIHSGAADLCSLAEVCGVGRACGGCLPAVRGELSGRGLPTDDHLDPRAIRAMLRERRGMAVPQRVAS